MNNIINVNDEFKIYEEDIICKHEYIDVIKLKDGYRLHNVCSGLILKVDKFTALISKLIETEMIYRDLRNLIYKYLPEFEIDENIIIEVIHFLIDIKFIKIKRRRYKTKILLINPSYRYSNEVYRKLSIVPPLGLANIATVLFNEGYDVSILDMLLNDIRPDELEGYINKIRPDIVGISMNFTSTANVCYEIAEKLRRLGIKQIIVGGNHATFTCEEIMEKEYIDYVVRFQGEYSFLELVNIIREGNYDKLSECKGIVYRENDNVIINDMRPLIKNMDDKPIPAWHLLEMHKYSDDNRWSINTSQGCPCNCAFCSTTAFNSKICYMSAERIIENIKVILRIEGNSKFISISFSDDAFTSNRKRIERLCNLIIEEKLKFIWACSTRVDLVDEEIMRLMYKAGCRAVLFGIESCSNEVLNKVGKRINIEQAKEAIKIAKKVGMRVKEMFILGLPFEDHKSTELIEEFFLETHPEEIRFGMLSAYPGTPIYTESKKYGIKFLTNNWSDYDLLRPTTENSILSSDEIYAKYLELTEKYESVNEEKLI